MKTIVVVGGGAGGLELVTALGHKLGKKKKANIVLIDEHLTHLWKPLLHEVAAGTLNSHEDELSYYAHANEHDYQFEYGRVTNVDKQTQEVLLGTFDEAGNATTAMRRIKYDTLVLAVGASVDSYGTPGVHTYCHYLNSQDEAERFQQVFLQQLIQLQNRTGFRGRRVSIAIVGGGATGVELAAELHYAVGHAMRIGFDKLKENGVHIHLVEAGQRLLPGLSETISRGAHAYLHSLGVEIHLGVLVTQVDEEGLYLQNNRTITADLKVWAAGVKAPEFLGNIGVKTNRQNQLVVNSLLQVQGQQSIFAIGDCACFIPEGASHPVPARAQVAHQQASVLAKSLVNVFNSKPMQTFKHHDYGSLISLSHNRTVGRLMGRIGKPIQVEGRIARWLYWLLYKFHQKAIHGLAWVMLFSLANRLTRRLRSRLKLH